MQLLDYFLFFCKVMGSLISNERIGADLQARILIVMQSLTFLSMLSLYANNRLLVMFIWEWRGGEGYFLYLT